MSMLPRLKPKEFYDLVVEVAIVRPGPIQGKMVHPYLKRRCGKEAVEYPSEAVRDVLKKTLGVPLFQEQAMKLVVVAAGFTPGEADQLRRAMGAWRRTGVINQFEQKLIHGMLANGYSEEFARNLFGQIEGFGSYGFPESHAASFALLVYVSAWIKCHYPAAFLAALLNSQPMGFYGPAQLVADARRHGVEVRPVDVNESDCDSTLERRETDGMLAVRLGWATVKGFSQAAARDSRWCARGRAVRFLWRLCVSHAILDARAVAFGISRCISLAQPVAPAGLLDVAGRGIAGAIARRSTRRAAAAFARAFPCGGSHPRLPCPGTFAAGASPVSVARVAGSAASGAGGRPR